MSGDSLTEPQASKEPSNLLNHHKLRTSHSERDLPNLIPSHPDGGTLLVHKLRFQCKVIRGHRVDECDQGAEGGRGGGPHHG